MNPTRVGHGVLALALLAGCASAPDEADRSHSIVITKFAPNTDFAKYKTYYLRPEIRTVSDEGELTPVSPSKAQPFLNATEQNLMARGFTPASKANADLGIELLYTEHVSTTYWCYSWWDPYYWGYPPYWGYYPYYGCDAAMWESNMLATSITDLSQGPSLPGAGGEAGSGGMDPAQERVAGVWFSGVYGVLLDTPSAVDGINQAFTQSPYLKAAP
ncbi:MAG TPA: DUF4136 domain-containing protein [Polyangiaceae bacterium]|nr:DUF4136 domain-containing protein [Polyangiaceae bacterium]